VKKRKYTNIYNKKRKYDKKEKYNDIKIEKALKKTNKTNKTNEINKTKKIIFLALIICFFLISAISAIYFLEIKEKIIGKTGIVGKAIAVGYVTFCMDVALPVLDPIGNLIAYAGEPFNFKVNATSPSGKTVYYYDNVSFFEIDELTGWINFTPSAENEGIYSIKISASHNICVDSSAFEIIDFTILANYSPEWNESKNYSFNLTEDVNFFLNISNYATDPDNDTVTFYSNPSNFPSFNLTENGIINFTPVDADVGIHYFNITASDGEGNSSHLFNFNITNINDAPILDPITTPQYSCEDSLFYYDVNASDDDLLIPNTIEQLYFYNSPETLFVINENTGEIIFTPNYNVAGNHLLGIYVTDEEEYDEQDVMFIIIPINDNPYIDSSIGTQTVRVNKTLSLTILASDEEDGTNSEGNLIFNISFNGGTELFSINETTGEINYTANDTDVGNYNITVCVLDQGITKPDYSSFCGDDYFPKSDCVNFSLAVLEFNNPPEIISYYPLDLEPTIQETESLYFNVSAYDPDGTTLTIYWYINDIISKSSFGDESDFTFNTTYGDAGIYKIKAVASDGEDSDFVQWNVTVLPITLPPPGGGGGGGGGGAVSCKEKWKCTGWSECQNISIIKALLTEEQYELWKKETYELTSRLKISFSQIGIQNRVCEDVSKCNTFLLKPSEIMSCVLIPSPSCSDGIRNCHDGACEILIDCGGPCKPCPIKIKKPIEFPRPTFICGDKRCNIREMFTCLGDCYIIWILWLIAMILFIMILFIIKKEKDKKEKDKNKKRKIKKGNYLK